MHELHPTERHDPENPADEVNERRTNKPTYTPSVERIINDRANQKFYHRKIKENSSSVGYDNMAVHHYDEVPNNNVVAHHYEQVPDENDREEQTNSDSSNNATPRNSGGANNELQILANSSGEVPVDNGSPNVVNPCVVPVAKNIKVNGFPRVDKRPPMGESRPTGKHNRRLEMRHTNSIDEITNRPSHKKYFGTKLNDNVEYY